jgi:hypothetical protein
LIADQSFLRSPPALGMVAVIMVRILHRDLNRYNNEQVSEEEQKEETGWKVSQTS